MGDTRAEGERNFWNGSEAVTAVTASKKSAAKPLLAKVSRLFSRLTLDISYCRKMDT